MHPLTPFHTLFVPTDEHDGPYPPINSPVKQTFLQAMQKVFRGFYEGLMLILQHTEISGDFMPVRSSRDSIRLSIQNSRGQG